MSIAKYWAVAAIGISLFASNIASAEGERVLIKDVTVLRSQDSRPAERQSVLIENGKIKAISSARDEQQVAANTTVIDGRGKLLMPGLIDTHAHLSFVGPLDQMTTWSWDYIGPLMAKRAKDTLMRGFTTIRDHGGPVAGLKKAIDQGLVEGPRIYPSGAFLTQTGGHADMRAWTDLHPHWSGHSTNWERLGFYRTVDGVDEVMMAARENLAHGATQLKLMGSGGMGSEFDPIDAIQFTAEEMRAAVQVAKDFGTYVGAHLQNGAAIQRALEAGVMSIDHGNGIDEKAMALLVKNGAFFNAHLSAPRVTLEYTEPSGHLRAKAQEVIDETEGLLKMIRKFHPKLTYCTDSFGPDGLWERIQVAELIDRQKAFGAREVLAQATTEAAQLLALTGKRNPYPGKIGVIEEGALADLLLVEPAVLDDVGLLAEPEKNISLIMKDGKIFKNRLGVQ